MGEEGDYKEEKEVDEFGFERGEHWNPEEQRQFDAIYAPVKARRALRWKKVCTQDEIPKNNQTKRFCRKGCPHAERARVWMDVSGASQMRQMQPDLYRTLVQSELTDATAKAQIEKDLHRTFPENIHFQCDFDEEQECHVNIKPKIIQMRNVLRAHTLNNPKEGYCQGLNYVAGMLLLITDDEENAFWILHQITHVLLPNYYSPTMTEIRADMIVLENLFENKMPTLYRKLTANDVSISLICTKWFLCLFIDTIPTETVLRVWDAMMFEGNKVLFRVALTVFKMHRPRLLGIADPGELYMYCKDMPKGMIDCQRLMQKCFKSKHVGKLYRKKIKKLRLSATSQIEAES